MRKGLRRTCLLVLLSTAFFQIAGVLIQPLGLGADDTKSTGRIAVASVDDSAASKMSNVAGRAPYYLIFDGKGVLIKALKNPSEGRGRGSSAGVVDLLVKESCKTVIAGRFGNKMRRQLEANNIDYHEFTGIAADTITTFVKTHQ